MKKSTKTKRAPAKAKKKSAKKPVKAKAKMLAKPTKKTMAKAKTKAKSKAKSKGLSVMELFQMKQQQQAQHSSEDPHVHQAPPHELHDKANLQPKPMGNTKLARGPGPGNRHN
ncbi:MAG: hypothetical protein AB7K68_07810 [Bacteriovoracia bacterium]